MCTVHQPRFALATMFDKLYFLGKGKELYFGPTVPHCLTFFEDSGFKCPEYVNPADFLLDLVNTTNNKPNPKLTSPSQVAPVINDEERQSPMVKDSRHEIIMKLAKAYEASEFRKVALDCKVPEELHGDKIFDTNSDTFYITSTWNQISVVTQRTFIHKWREPIATMTQAFNAVFMPLLFGSVYWNLDLSQQSSYDRISAVSLIVLMLSFFCI
eukprot:788644_1